MVRISYLSSKSQPIAASSLQQSREEGIKQCEGGFTEPTTPAPDPVHSPHNTNKPLKHVALNIKHPFVAPRWTSQTSAGRHRTPSPLSALLSVACSDDEAVIYRQIKM